MTRKLLAYVGVVALLMAFATYSPAFGQASSSPDPANKSTGPPCAANPNFGTQIDFDVHPSGTIIDVQYLGQGVKFGTAAGGPITEARTDGARPGDLNVLVGQPIYTGDVHASFWLGSDAAFVTQVGGTVGWIDGPGPGTVTLEAYDCEGDLVDTYASTIQGVEWFQVSADTIHKVIFFMGGDPAGSDVDCFTYDDLTPCEARIPTLTEWGMIIFCALLFGWMAWMIVRRRRTATVRV